MPTTTLTPRQAEVLAAIKRFQDEHGYCPTIRELGELLTITSSNGVASHLRALEKKGALRRVVVNGRKVARAWSVVD
jgi:repressor LexA